MDNEIVPYEQALELKQLGFDEPCFLYYGENNILSIFTINIKYFILWSSQRFARKWFKPNINKQKKSRPFQNNMK